MERCSMSEMIATRLAWKNKGVVGRIFACCLTREHILVIAEYLVID